MAEGGVEPGWYPDYDRPPGHQRYWDGHQWTERRTVATERSRTPWLAAGVVAAVVLVLAAVGLGVAVLGGDGDEEGETGASVPVPAEPSADDPGADDGDQSWEVSAAVDGQTMRLSDGTQVRLAGVAGGCAALELAKLVVGERVTLSPTEPDRDEGGVLVRYVDRGGVDVGKRLIQRGWAKASDEPNPRRAIYRRVDARSPDGC